MKMSTVLAEACRTQAGWRRDNAEDYPDDLPNKTRASNLEAMATWAEGLDPKDERLARLGEFVAPRGEGSLRSSLDLGQEALRRLCQCDAKSPEEFASLLAEVVDLAAKYVPPAESDEAMIRRIKRQQRVACDKPIRPGETPSPKARRGSAK